MTEYESILAEEVTRLRGQVEGLKKAVAREKMATIKSDGEALRAKLRLYVQNTLLLTVPVVLAFGAIGLAYKSIMASGEVKGCYIHRHHDEGLFDLQEDVDWRVDPIIGTFCSIEQAREAAIQINCPVDRQ